MPGPSHSTQEWKGLTSNKWSAPERLHLRAKDQLADKIVGMDVPVLGRKHFEQTYSGTVPYKSTLRTFPDRANRETSLKEIKIVTKPPYQHAQRPYGHKEKTHLTSKESGHHDYSKFTTRVFPDVANKETNSEYTLEKKMGRKTTVEFLDEQRNFLPYRTLGDKTYKNPEYSDNFFKEGGLVAGSSIRKRPPKADSFQDKSHVKIPHKPGTMIAKEREAKQIVDEDRKAVCDLGDWEQNTLKEANPKWRDPDAPEVEVVEKVDPKAQAAAKGKKATKK